MKSIQYKKIIVPVITSILVGTISLLFNKAFPETNHKSTKINNKIKENPNIRRTKLFEDYESLNEQLTHGMFFIKNTKNNQIIIKKNEQQVESFLSNLITTRLKNVFLKKGINFNSMSGRIYYDVKKSSIEVLLMWKDNQYSKEFNNYDRFEISFYSSQS